MMHDTEFINATAFIKSNPKPAFSKVMNDGVELSYRTDGPVGERVIYVKATLSGRNIGGADFAEEDDDTISIQNIRVDPSFRLRGVGKAMCVLAAKILQKPLENIWDVTQTTKDFKTFWQHLVSQLKNKFD